QTQVKRNTCAPASTKKPQTLIGGRNQCGAPKPRNRQKTHQINQQKSIITASPQQNQQYKTIKWIEE
ncbi:hypothetical protein, partial [Stenotrophomonas maltophilia]|uniref:hypothetical protein n=1 Tax=Stenotrophomonas maltophilia TaxID=40324 RepID=UPI0031456CA5